VCREEGGTDTRAIRLRSACTYEGRRDAEGNGGREGEREREFPFAAYAAAAAAAAAGRTL
jgi:hypothetical protein